MERIWVMGANKCQKNHQSRAFGQHQCWKQKRSWEKWVMSRNQCHPQHLENTYYTSKCGLRNLQRFGHRFTVNDQVLQDTAGQQDLLLGALQQETHGRLTSRLPWIWQNPHMSSRLLGDLREKRQQESRELGCLNLENTHTLRPAWYAKSSDPMKVTAIQQSI